MTESRLSLVLEVTGGVCVCVCVCRDGGGACLSSTTFKRLQLYSKAGGGPRSARGPEKRVWLPAPHFPAHFPGRWKTEEGGTPPTPKTPAGSRFGGGGVGGG